MQARIALALALVLAAPARGQEPIRPAELPPPDFRGQQYVDSRGCLFMRAGTPENELWLPRVTRDGVPLCGNPPSGNRVPVVEEGVTAVVEAPATADAPEEEATAAATLAAPTAPLQGYFVAVGSFGVAENVERARARLAALNYRVALGNTGGLVTVFAGPYATAEDAARARTELVKLGFPDALVIKDP